MRRTRNNLTQEAGFTLVELLTVMLIIAVLAGLAIPAFFSQRDKAQDADAKSDLRVAQTAIETFATDNNDDYSTATIGDLQTIEETVNGSITVAPTATGYTLTLVSNAGQTFVIERDGGAIDYTCSPPSEGGCPETQTWAGD